MPCNCTGVRIRKCNCKVYGYASKTSVMQNVVLFGQDGIECRSERLNFLLTMFENLYEKCAGYNLRYCPLRERHRRDKHVTRALKDIIILVCFLLANFVVFLTIATRMVIHLYLVLRETVHWIQRYLVKSDYDEPITFETKLESEYMITAASIVK